MKRKNNENKKDQVVQEMKTPVTKRKMISADTPKNILPYKRSLKIHLSGSITFIEYTPPQFKYMSEAKAVREFLLHKDTNEKHGE